MKKKNPKAAVYEVRRYDNYLKPAPPGIQQISFNPEHSMTTKSGKHVFATTDLKLAQSCLRGSKVVMAIFTDGRQEEDNVSRIYKVRERRPAVKFASIRRAPQQRR